MKLLNYTLLAASVGLGLGSARAVNLPVDNFTVPGFLPPHLADTIGAGGSIGPTAGWTVVSGNVDVLSPGYWQSPDGNPTIDLDGTVVGAIDAALTVPSTGTVTVDFDLAGNPEGGPGLRSLLVTLGSTSEPFIFDVTGHSDANMGWIAESLVFPDQSAGPETLTFASTDGPAGTPSDFGPAIGAVSASFSPNLVPDGGLTALSLSFALAALGWRRRRV